MPSQLPSPSVFAHTPATTLVAFGRALVAVRQQAATSAPRVAAPVVADQSVSIYAGNRLNRLNQSIVATNAFEANISATPIGMLNLERIEMTPAGIERGELIATIPLAPLEQTAVTQKEWSVTTREFTSIVTDSLENYSETGVTEKTDIAQSTTSQTDHANQFNINASVSGSYGLVTVATATAFGSQNKESVSAKESRDHAVKTTRSASARVKQEHKVTITTTTVTGTSQTTTRTLQNPSATAPMRIDYFSMMRKWRIRLYRYGLRLTYDIAIPEPGGALREVYAQLDALRQKFARSFTFDLKPTDIDDGNFPQLEAQFEVTVEPPPRPTLSMDVGGPVPNLANDAGWRFYQDDFDIPDNYEVSDVSLEAMIGNQAQAARRFDLFGVGAPWEADLQNGAGGINRDLTLQDNNFFVGKAGHQTFYYRFIWVDAASVVFHVALARTLHSYEQWQASAWTAFHDAAQAAFYSEQQAISAQIEALQAQLENVDTLTLRREENDEIMKGVLRWLLGTGFDFMPPDVVSVFQQQKDAQGNPVNDIVHGVSFTGNELGITADSWTTMFQYQEMVKFINEAIEWENVLYFLYSYFWDVPQSWDFIRRIEHPDKTRQAFLRSGSARVVLPVRKGYETKWTAFVELGDLQSQIVPPGSTPYMTIAQAIQNYDDTNYPGIPPANPGGPALSDAPEVATACSSSVPASPGPVTVAVDSSDGFVVGAQAVIDTPDSGSREVQAITGVPDATHLTIQRLNNRHDGTSGPFPIVQQGEHGLLIAEWYEYTPSSGTDIAVTSDLLTMG